MVSTENPDNHTRFVAKLEGIICRHADTAWWFTDEALNAAKRCHPELGERGHCILPGVEPFHTDATYQRGKQMIIGHFGSLSATRSLLPVAQAMAVLFERRPEIRTDLRVHVYGGNIDAAAMKESEQRNLGDVFVCFGRQERSPVTGKSGQEQVTT